MEKKNRQNKYWLILFLIFILLLSAFLFLNLEKKELDDQIRSSLKGSTANLSDGSVYFNYSESSEGPIVILVHGFSTPSYIWGPTFDFLDEKGYRVLSYDLYGRGYSDRPDTDYTLKLYVRQLRELILELDLGDEKINILGLSLGGPIAAAYTNNYPNDIQTITLIDPYTLPATKKEIFPLNIPFIGEYITTVYLVPFMLPNSQKGDFYNPELFPDWVDRYRDQLQYKGFRKAILSTIRNMVNISGIREYELLDQLDIPILLIWGKEDKSILLEDIRLILSILPNVEFHPIEEAAHLPHYERSDIVNPIIETFLEINN